MLVSGIGSEDAGGLVWPHTASTGRASSSLWEHARGLKLHLSTFLGNKTSDILKAVCNVLRYNETVGGKY